MKPSLTPKELAQAIGVSESSLKRWADDGLLLAIRTPGGHRRIAMTEAIRFIRATKVTVVRPDLLGLCDVPGLVNGVQTTELSQTLYEALYDDDHAKARSVLLGAFLEGVPVATLCDGPMRCAITRIGELWRHEPNGIVIEHRATDTCSQILHLIRSLLPAPAPLAPGALGGAPAGDPYLMPTLMAATVLRELGYKDVNLGPETPVAVVQRAIAHYQPKLVWLAFSTPLAAEQVMAKIGSVTGQLADIGGSLIIGGRALCDIVVPEIANLHVLGSMRELGCMAQSLRSEASPLAY